MTSIVLKGKVEKMKLNGHFVSVIKPTRKISYEEGVKKIREIFENAEK